MNPGRFFMPNMSFVPSGMRGMYYLPRTGIISRALNGLRTFNWRNLLSGANRTLNVVNQTIPLIRQAKPMVNNVKNMFQIARAFNNETKSSYKKHNINNNNKDKTNVVRNVHYNDEHTDNSPTFFV